jgi:hypothetical protein
MTSRMRLDHPVNKRDPRTRHMRLLVLLGTAILGLLPHTHAQQSPRRRVPAQYTSLIPAGMKKSVPRRSGTAMLLMARAFGMSNVRGKAVDRGGSARPSVKPKKLRDVGIGIHPTKHEDEPTIAASPRHKKTLVAGSHFFGPPAPEATRCVAYRSVDGGATWSRPVAMPQLTASSECSDPVLAYAPDGSRVYYAYMDIKTIVTDAPPTLTTDLDILVSYSDNDGATWTGPVMALNGTPTTVVFEPFSVTPGFDYDKPWIATHVDASQSSWVYVSATRFEQGPPFDCRIAFARSGSKGAAFGAPALLDSSSGGCGSPIVVSGSRPSGGPGATVLVAWYNSGRDGWLEGSFDIRVRASRNHGATFGPAITAAHDTFEASFWLGPLAFYHRWWPVMFPDLEIDPGGAAHIAYTHDPQPGTDTPEDGDIRYVTSDGLPYRNWSIPVTVNDDGLERAQGFAALETEHGGQSSSVHVIWEDHRLSPDVPIKFPRSPNLFYDIFQARKVPGGLAFGRNQRVSDASSINDFVFVGDYIDLAASHKPFGVWTDRRDKQDIFDLEDDVFGSQIKPGKGRSH